MCRYSIPVFRKQRNGAVGHGYWLRDELRTGRLACSRIGVGGYLLSLCAFEGIDGLVIVISDVGWHQNQNDNILST